MEMTSTVDIIFAEPLDRYVVIEYENILRSIRFIKREEKLIEKKTLRISFELEEYFRGERQDFSCAYDISWLSDFEQRVLHETEKIRYGETVTYSELARNMGSRAFRAAGRALSKNPVPIVIPCHRVVAKKGIGGYSAGPDIKIRLLELEKKYSLSKIS